MLAKSPKRRRTERVATGPLVLTERDYQILLLLGLCRLASSEQIMRESFFPSADRASRRLRALFDAGYLSVTLRSSTSPNILSLTALGISSVADRFPEQAGRIGRAGPLRLSSVAHKLLVVDVRLYAAGLGVAIGAPLLRWSNAGGELDRERGLGEFHLEPDGLAEFVAPGGSLVVAVEADRGHEGLQGVLQSKFARYARCFAARRLDALWVVQTGKVARRRHIEELAQRAGIGTAVQVLDHAYILERPVKELPGARAAAEEQRGSLNTPGGASLEVPVPRGL